MESSDRPRVLLAGLFHETNTFIDGRSGPDDFEVRRGEAIFEARGDASPLAGALEGAGEAGWDVLPVRDARAVPGPRVEDRVVEAFLDDLERASRSAGPVDGVYLVLHGAMVSESAADVEGEVLARVRELQPEAAVGGVLDLHANLTARMAACSHALLAYRENPHTDAHATAVRAARLLDRLMRSGERPRTFWAHPPILWPPSGTGTDDEPMRTLERMAREIEDADPDVLAVNVCAGFSFADIPDAGVGFTAVTVGDEDASREHLRLLSERAVAMREQGTVSLPDANEAVAGLKLSGRGPIVIAEPSDNIGAGAPGDGTGLLRALIEHDVGAAVVVINDIEAVAALAGLKLGESQRISIGGRGSAFDPGPVSLDVALVSRSDGRFELEDPLSHLASMFGMQIDMGPCAVVRRGGLRILLTSRRTPPFDLGQLRSQGIQPESLAVIGVKAAVAHRRAYDPIAGGSLAVATPGPCSSDLRALPYRSISRPVYPLDEI